MTCVDLPEHRAAVVARIIRQRFAPQTPRNKPHAHALDVGLARTLFAAPQVHRAVLHESLAALVTRDDPQLVLLTGASAVLGAFGLLGRYNRSALRHQLAHNGAYLVWVDSHQVHKSSFIKVSNALAAVAGTTPFPSKRILSTQSEPPSAIRTKTDSVVPSRQSSPVPLHLNKTC